MKHTRKQQTARLRDARPAVIVRLGLLALVTFGSVALIWGFLHVSKPAHASNVTQVATTKEPLDVVQDGTNVWVAEPGCDLVDTQVCSSSFPGIIGKYSLANPNTKTDFTEPSGYSSPAFLALDGHGNVWFTEPTTDSIGELTPGNPPSQQWLQWNSGITAGAAPQNLAFDNNGNIWFTEGLRDAVGFFNTSTHTAVETSVRAGTDPDGIIKDSAGNMWFGEDNGGELEEFTPTSNGAITITTSAHIGQINPQMLVQDAQHNLWYSEGRNIAIGEYDPMTHLHTDYPLTSVITGGSYVGGIGVDGSGNIWFDEGVTGDVGYFNPATKTATIVTTIAVPTLGLTVDGANNVWATEKSGKLAEIGSPTPPPTATPTGSPSPTGSPTPTLPPGPVFKTWYFAEGHIGQSFQEYLTVQNPDPVNSCAVSFEYLLSSGAQTPITVTVKPNTRLTENVNEDLGVSRSSSTAEDVSTIVTVNTATTPNCTGVVAERPMYFVNALGVSSGHDALGATHLGKSFFFPDVTSSPGFRDFITILNPPSGQAAAVTVTYFKGGVSTGMDTLTVQPGTRGTITPGKCGCTTGTHVAAAVSSSQLVDVELPIYFSGFSAGNAGIVSGAAVVVGAPAASNDWRLAEGYLDQKFQEDIVLANFSTTAVTATMLLEYDNSSTLSVSVKIGPQDTALEDINSLTAQAAGAGTCSPSPCNLTKTVSAEITAPSGMNFVAERELYFQYYHKANGRILAATGGTAILGQSGAASITSYSFAEGYTNIGYDEWLTIQNPTSAAETIWVTIVNGAGSHHSFSVTVGPKTRGTVDLVYQVLSSGLCVPGATSTCWEISLTVQTVNNGGAFVAERPMYFNASGSQGGSVVIGYVGG